MSHPQLDAAAAEVRSTVVKLLELASQASHPLIALDALLHAYANAAVMSNNAHLMSHAFKTMLEDMERQGLAITAKKHLH